MTIPRPNQRRRAYPRIIGDPGRELSTKDIDKVAAFIMQHRDRLTRIWEGTDEGEADFEQDLLHGRGQQTQ